MELRPRRQRAPQTDTRDGRSPQGCRQVPLRLLAALAVTTLGVTLMAGHVTPANAIPPVTESAAEVAADVGRGEPATVAVARTDSQGELHIDQVRVVGHDEAQEQIEARLADPRTLSVSIAEPTYTTDADYGTVTPGDSDTYRSAQWALTALDADTAWKTATGKGVTVAVIDSGIDADLPDLHAKLEAPATCLLVCDDTAPPVDDTGHGTHVAGIIAARANNGNGIAGLAPDAALMPIKALRNGSGTAADIAAAIVYAVQHNADIINLSLGATRSEDIMRLAVDYALRKGVTVVAAAGNSGVMANIHYPAAYKGVLAVGATTEHGEIANFSSRGWWVGVAAPGASIASLYNQPPYVWTLSGTSMASPYVAAEAALVKQVLPHLRPADLGGLISSTAKDLGQPGVDSAFGSGLIQPVAALRAAVDQAPATITLSMPPRATYAAPITVGVTSNRPTATLTCTAGKVRTVRTLTVTDGKATMVVRARAHTRCTAMTGTAKAVASMRVRASLAAVALRRPAGTVTVQGRTRAGGHLTVHVRYANRWLPAASLTANRTTGTFRWTGHGTTFLVTAPGWAGVDPARTVVR